jgi:hypothetical protein
MHNENDKLKLNKISAINKILIKREIKLGEAFLFTNGWRKT